MAQLHVEAEATANASPQTVWALVSDVTKYPSWGPWSDGHYEKTGEEPPGGVGAVQVLRSAQRYLGRHTTSVEEAERATLLGWGVTAWDARRYWKRISDPALWPTERLFFELYVQALFGRLGDDQFLDSTVEGWIAPVAAAMVQAGGSEATARADARLGLAVVRGLLLDLLATGDRDGVTEAYERFLQLYEANRAGG